MLVLLNVPTPLFTFSANLVSKRRLYYKSDYNSNKPPPLFKELCPVARQRSKNSYILS